MRFQNLHVEFVVTMQDPAQQIGDRPLIPFTLDNW